MVKLPEICVKQSGERDVGTAFGWTGLGALSGKDAIMSDQTLLSRIGGWFKRTGNEPGNGDLPLVHPDDMNTSMEHRSSFLRPWARRDAAIQQLQDGFGTLTELMSGIRSNLERQNERQEELARYLSHLPQALQTIPESNRMQGETLKAIHQQLATQSDQQGKLTDILGQMSRTSFEQRGMLDELRERVETVRETDKAIADNLGNVGIAMEAVTKNSSASAEVLTQMRDRIDTRDDQLEKILHKQSIRFTTMLAIAIFLSIAALAAVGIVGYLLMIRK
jgi:archaellum component FlaC